MTPERAAALGIGTRVRWDDGTQGVVVEQRPNVVRVRWDDEEEVFSLLHHHDCARLERVRD